MLTLSIFLVVLYLGFEKWEDQIILDESDMGNNAYLNNGAFVAPHRGMCGHFAGLGTSGDILLEDTTFRGKPRSGITVASWVNLARTSRGMHSLFSTARVMTIGQVMGKDGLIFRWFSQQQGYFYTSGLILTSIGLVSIRSVWPKRPSGLHV